MGKGILPAIFVQWTVFYRPHGFLPVITGFEIRTFNDATTGGNGRLPDEYPPKPAQGLCEDRSHVPSKYRQGKREICSKSTVPWEARKIRSVALGLVTPAFKIT